MTAVADKWREIASAVGLPNAIVIDNGAGMSTILAEDFSAEQQREVWRLAVEAGLIRPAGGQP